MQKIRKLVAYVVVCLLVMRSPSYGAALEVQQPSHWQHAFYAHASSGQMSVIDHLDAVSFGWAQVLYDEVAHEMTVATDAYNAYGFRTPKGFHIPLDYAAEKGAERYLMVFFNDANGKAMRMLSDQKLVEEMVEELVALCTVFEKDGQVRSFEGITIDFEGFIQPELQQPFNVFLEKLDTALGVHDKKLNVAVQPIRNFKGYDYKTIGKLADKVIVMAHDYDAKRLTVSDKEQGYVYTPVAPFTQVYTDLELGIKALGDEVDTTKFILQIAFASAQWQLKDGQVLHEYPYTPSYDRIDARNALEGSIQGFDPLSHTPYTYYTQDGITNVIWYENLESVALKVELVELLELGGVSYWRLGTIPQDVMSIIQHDQMQDVN